MNKNKLSKKEINNLYEENIISKEQKLIFEEKYLSKNNENKLFMIFAILGVVFIAAGIISLIAYNWGKLNLTLRTLISLAPLMITQYFLYNTYIKKKSGVWEESSTLANSFSLVISFGLIAQTYQLNNDTIDLFFIASLCSIPMLYLFKSYYSLLFNSIIAFIGMWVGGWHLSLLGLFILPIYANDILKENNNHKLFKVIYLSFVLKFLANYVVTYDYHMLMLLVAMFAITCFSKTNIYKTIGKISLVSCLLFLSNFPFASEVEYLRMGYLKETIEISSWHIVIPIICILVGLAFYIFKSKKSDFIIMNIPLLAYAIFHLCVKVNTLPFMFVIISLLFDLAFVLVLVYYIVSNFKNREFGLLKLNVFILNLYVIIKIFNSELGLTLKGVFFIVMGIGFLVCNYLFSKHIKKVGEIYE